MAKISQDLVKKYQHPDPNNLINQNKHKKIIPRYSIIKLLNTSDKKEIWKEDREKDINIDAKTNISMNLSSETFKTEDNEMTPLKC